MTGFAHLAAAGPLLVALGLCLLAGLVSFASPCVVPLVPGYLSYLAAVVGVPDEEASAGADQSPAGSAVAGHRIGGAVRGRVHHGVRAGHRRGPGDDVHVDHQPGAAAAGGRRADHRDGAGVRGLHPGVAATRPGSARGS